MQLFINTKQAWTMAQFFGASPDSEGGQSDLHSLDCPIVFQLHQQAQRLVTQLPLMEWRQQALCQGTRNACEGHGNPVCLLCLLALGFETHRLH